MERQSERRRAGATVPERAGRTVNTFVVRQCCAGTRYEIAHLQSGRHTVASDLTSASAWIGGFATPPSEATPEWVA